VALVEGLAEAKGLNLSFQSDDSLPELVVGDAGRLRQAILNLVNNAVKFTSSGSVLVKLAYDAQTSRLSCDVTDTGPGIPLDKQALLFKRFSQVDNSVSRVYGGSGLGLAITRSLVELMGGEVSLVSQEGQGSTFSFYVVAPIASELAMSEVAAESSAQWDQGQGGQILIVDDREENREILRLMITAVGLTPVLASSGDEGVALANKDPYSLILMDVRMPGLSGLEASRMIRQSSKQNARTPIIAITANVSPNEIEECRQAGMQDHVSKPIRAAELLQKVSTWIDTEIESQSPSPATDARDQKAMA
jgi:CheY-like chemotaxis protein